MKRLVAVLFALLLLMSPATAAERVTSFPELQPFRSGRMDLAITINKEVLLYAKADFIDDRLHLVAVDAQRNQVVEIVLIGERLYLRENTNTRWLAITFEIDDPSDVGLPGTVDFEDIEEYITIYNLGTVDVRGVPTTQYQVQFDPEVVQAPSEINYALNFNAFIGNADAFLRKLQITLLDETYADRPMLLETPLDIYDHNQPIEIGSPAPELVDEIEYLAALQRDDLPGGDRLPVWMRPLVEYSLQTKGYIP